MLQLGLVGFGKIARDQHLPAIEGTVGLELVAVASRHSHAEGVSSYPDIGSMLDAEPGIDAVILCMPPQPRFDAAHAALIAGKHVFLEKPPGATLSEVQALIALAERQGVSLFASWHSREAAAVAQAKAWLLGAEIHSASIAWKEDVRVWHPGQTWIWEPGGFGVFDPGINALSILTEVLPEPVRVLSAELDVPVNCAAPIAARLTLATGANTPIAAEFDFRQTGPQSWDISVETDKGSLVLANGGNTLAIDGAAQSVDVEAEYPRLYSRFADLVRRGESHVDLAPLQLVADAFLCGRARPTEAFYD
ncbi:Gfo/Idh/MocA family oxidoreductase [Novosphingobium sp. G106]|uniref:Gfo/Idh/MocA family protein n=1 Tax=Novosphingobium sp. G106 TaxID=2849500 RepID=UPI001C2D8EF3|nr:Gfo/Idh/MocA family oxidoreductase [Novosphingobium sp. G106]MBV1687936.1 Gfo/Idh/MocA family oxidoreductase [Novosphingobium sp. G106]